MLLTVYCFRDLQIFYNEKTLFLRVFFCFQNMAGFDIFLSI